MKLNRREVLRRTAAAAAAVTLAPALDARSAPAAPADAWIWDCHGHLGGVTGTAEERVDRILHFADRMQVRRLVVSMGLSWSYDPSPDHFRQENDDVLRAFDRAPARVLPFVYVSPKHEKESLGEIERCARHGPMVGVKLWVAMECNKPPLDSIAAMAGELGVPILQHTFLRVGGNLKGESTPADLAELAARHPKTVFFCAHCGAQWERGLRQIRAAKNVNADIGGMDPEAGLVEMAVRELGADRVLYGSDFAGRSFASQLAKVQGAAIPEAARRLILCDNLRRILTPILKAKGMPL